MRPHDLLQATPAGLYCPPGDFHIDPVRAVPRAVITHGHSDHARPGHRAVLATQATLDMMVLRHGAVAGGQALGYGERLEVNGVTVWLAPAGHVLGSAQVVVQGQGCRIVVSGDYKRCPDPTCLPFEPVACEVFVTEATFALPVFRHPPPEREIGRLLHSLEVFPERCHLIGAYALGKAQRLLKLLRFAGYERPIYLPGPALAMCELYGRHGQEFGELRPAKGASPEALAGGHRADLRSAGGALGNSPARSRARLRFRLAWHPRPGAPARRRTAAGDLRSRRLARAAGNAARIAAGRGLGDPRTGGGAGTLGGARWPACPRAGTCRPRRRGRAVRQFALLLDALSCQQQDTGKQRLLVSYLRRLPDPDRGYGLAALVGGLELARAKPAMLRAIVADRVDAELFQQSCEYVGDLGETVALIWPGEVLGNAEIGLAEVVERLASARPAELPGLLSGWLDRLAPAERWALLKLASGGLRVGVSAGLARQALATLGGVESGAIEEVWHAQRPPYGGLFAWLAGRGPCPARPPGVFRSPMLAEALDEAALAGLDPAAYFATWQWAGPPVQLVAEARVARLYSHQGEDLSAVFPEIVGAADFEAVLDGELRIARDGQALPFADLRRRLNRKRPTAALLRELPAVLHVRDVLQVASEDLRALPFAERRRRLEAWHGAGRSPRIELSGLLPFVDWTALRAWRSRPPEGAVGLLLQRKDSAYCRAARRRTPACCGNARRG